MFTSTTVLPERITPYQTMYHHSSLTFPHLFSSRSDQYPFSCILGALHVATSCILEARTGVPLYTLYQISQDFRKFAKSHNFSTSCRPEPSHVATSCILEARTGVPLYTLYQISQDFRKFAKPHNFSNPCRHGASHVSPSCRPEARTGALLYTLYQISQDFSNCTKPHNFSNPCRLGASHEPPHVYLKPVLERSCILCINFSKIFANSQKRQFSPTHVYSESRM